jgi:hypothetical protein
MKFLNFFLLLWVIFALLDSDPDTEFGSTDLIEFGSGSTDLIESGSETLLGIDNHPVSVPHPKKLDPGPVCTVQAAVGVDVGNCAGSDDATVGGPTGNNHWPS